MTIHSAGSTAGEEPPLITDRPDQTESAHIVPSRLLQIEAGWTYGESRDAEADRTLQAFPLALLRFGLTDRFELRLGVPGLTIESEDRRSGASTKRGLVDATLGFKTLIAQEKGAWPRVAFLGTLIVPSGDEDFSSDRVEPSFRFIFANELSDRLSLGYNLGMVWLTEPDDAGALETLSFFDWTVALGISLSKRTGVFVETFGQAPVDSGAAAVTSIDTGITYLLNPRLQLDAAASVGLSSAAPDWTAGLGLSFRFPRSR